MTPIYCWKFTVTLIYPYPETELLNPLKSPETSGGLHCGKLVLTETETLIHLYTHGFPTGQTCVSCDCAWPCRDVSGSLCLVTQSCVHQTEINTKNNSLICYSRSPWLHMPRHLQNIRAKKIKSQVWGRTRCDSAYFSTLDGRRVAYYSEQESQDQTTTSVPLCFMHLVLLQIFHRGIVTFAHFPHKASWETFLPVL